MPETYFRVRWPDGREQSCYSPSSVVAEYFKPDTEYALQEFVGISETALAEASERVKQKFGYYCSGASDQLQ
ncbi:MAG: MSMEG_0570 family nitrogen starvation response protein, partial [Ketobacter sp.]